MGDIKISIEGDYTVDATQLAAILALHEKDAPEAFDDIQPNDEPFEGFEGAEDGGDDNQGYAIVSGTKVPRAKFAFAPPGSKPSEWKLPVDKRSRASNALARWNQTKGIPDSAKHGVLAKI